MELRFALTSAAPWAERAGEAVMDALDAAVARGSDLVATSSRERHPYTDRTGDLTKYTLPLPTVRDGDTVAGGVRARQAYAEAVERGTARSRPYPYLEPALARNVGRIEELLGDLLDDATARGRGL